MKSARLPVPRHPSTARTLALTLALITLAGCASSQGLAPQGRLSDASQLSGARSFADVTLSPGAWPREDWWQRLGDAQLDRLVREALADSPDLQLAQARADQASALAQAYDADRGPSLDANASVTRSRLSRSQDPTGQGDRLSTLRSVGLTFDYSFDLWGGKRAAWEAALGQARAAEIDRQAARLTVSANVVRAYNELAYAQRQEQLAQDDLKRTGQMLDLSQGRLEAGLDSQYQYEQTASLQASAEESLASAEQQVRSARIELAVLLGKGPDRGLDIADPQLLDPGQLALPSQLPAQLLGRRPDLVAARWRVEAAARDIDVSKANFYPNLNLNAGIGAESLLGDALFGTASRFWNIGPALSLPIFDAGRRRADLASRDADYDVVVAQYNQTLVRALGDVSQGISRLASLRRQIDSQQRARDIARNSFDLAMQRYGSGIGNYLDALSIEQQLLQAERTLASLYQQQIDASVLLTQALGGGFQVDPNEFASTQEGSTHE